jgi:hypothetical protein
MSDPIRQEAENTLHDLGLWKLPVDPLRIAKEEGIELAPSHYGTRFDARIEYFKEFDAFGIYYKVRGRFRNSGRVNFSLAHELGHFYIPEHRRLLRAGLTHNSVADYGSKAPYEREADRFAANLLMPQELFIKHVEEKHSGFCTLKNLRSMAEHLGTSISSTAVRYCDIDIEPAMVITSRQRIIQWSWSAPCMKPLGTWYVETGTPIPAGSRTAALYDRLQASHTDEYSEGSVAASIWFKWPKVEKLWEEVLTLGDTLLTYLAATNF